jgi:hypothetical protein
MLDMVEIGIRTLDRHGCVAADELLDDRVSEA